MSYLIHASLTRSRVEKMHKKNECGSDILKGFCLCCGAVIAGVKTDARWYKRCEKKACKAQDRGTVFGTLEILMGEHFGGTREMGKKRPVETLAPEVAPEVEAVTVLTEDAPEVAAILAPSPAHEIADARINCSEDVWEALREIEELLYA